MSTYNATEYSLGGNWRKQETYVDATVILHYNVRELASYMYNDRTAISSFYLLL